MRRKLTGYYREWQRHRAFARWFKRQMDRGSAIHASLELIGIEAAFEFIDIQGKCTIETNVSIYVSPHQRKSPQLVIEEGCYIGRNTMLGVYADLRLCQNSLIAPNCYITTGNHRFDRRDVPIVDQGHATGAVVVEKDAWVGTHSVVLPGVRIGQGAIIGAGAVVNCTVPAYQIWGGVPARFIKDRP